MTQTFTARFVHRLNDDGTVDSICSDCFVTVAVTVRRYQNQLLSAKSEDTIATYCRPTGIRTACTMKFIRSAGALATCSCT